MKKILNVIKNVMLYGGLDESEYKTHRPQILEENRKNLSLYSLIGAIAFFFLTLITMISGGFTTTNLVTYIASGMLCFGIFLLIKYIAPNKPKIIYPLVYLTMAVMYAFSLSITILHKDMPAVTMIVMMLVVPLLFTDRPVRMTITTLIVIVVFVILVKIFKTPEIAEVDIWNGISFGIVAIAAEIVILISRYKGVKQEHRIAYLSETDILTGAKNRNAYETNLEKYPSKCESSISCVYADVNGLHDLNNTSGHKAGDILLQAAALELENSFGANNSYRVGGDEFVAFAIDSGDTEIEEKIAKMTQSLVDRGYNVSFGFASAKKSNVDMTTLVKTAEDRMFAEKERYYQETGKERR